MKADTGCFRRSMGTSEGVGGGVVADGMAALSSSVADSPGDRDTALGSVHSKVPHHAVARGRQRAGPTALTVCRSPRTCSCSSAEHAIGWPVRWQLSPDADPQMDDYLW